jgi:SOS-response transcriptional repressor LexA
MGQNIGKFTARVNGNLTACRVSGGSSYSVMNLTDVLARIERRLKVVGISAHAASRAAGKPDAIRNIRRAVANGGGGGLTTSTLTALADVLGTTVSWLTTGTGPEDPRVQGATIPVWGRVGAGGLVFNYQQEAQEIDRITAPSETTEHTGAVEIVGESLGRLFEGWYAIYDELRFPPTADLLGRMCILELDDGRMFIKRVMRGRGRKFVLESNYDPPIYDVAVTWAARVRQMVPP